MSLNLVSAMYLYLYKHQGALSGMIVNHGPMTSDTEFVLSMRLQTTYGNRTQTYNLEHVQSSLMVAFDQLQDVDSVFKANFWKSINLSCKSIPTTYKILNLRKIKQEPKVSVPDHSRVFFNGQWHSVTNFKLEHPHIFIGRGAHPWRGTCKFPVKRSEVTLNTFGDRSFRERGFERYVHEPTANWSARWCDPLTNQQKYIIIRPDEARKFNLARRLKRNLHRIHLQNDRYLRKGGVECRQLALACHFIEKVGIRVGNEKDTSTCADTVGCCTLEKHKHIRILNPDRRLVEFEFDGKDSIRFYKTCALDALYFRALAELLRRKGRLLFDRINPSKVNRYLSNIVPGVTAKVFRTMKASNEFQKTLKRTNNLRQANLKAAHVCNHKSGTGDNLQTSRSNYIDPRIYYAYVHAHPEAKRSSWFVDADWAKKTEASFVF